jgi:hypothetical protein
MKCNNCGSDVGASSEGMIRAADGSILDADQGWYKFADNPFGHACCDCGLYHQVEYAIVDSDGEVQELAEGHGPAFRFTRDDIETEKLRLLNLSMVPPHLSAEGKSIVAMLGQEVPVKMVLDTTFSGVPITELGRDSLLRLVALLASAKQEQPEPSGIILAPSFGRR